MMQFFPTDKNKWNIELFFSHLDFDEIILVFLEQLIILFLYIFVLGLVVLISFGVYHQQNTISNVNFIY